MRHPPQHLRGEPIAVGRLLTEFVELQQPATRRQIQAMAAATRLDKVSVGPIVIRNGRALVAKPGALSESLLGMSFLERLQSYSVERGRLVLKAK